MTRPIRAAASSANTARRVGLELAMTWSRVPRFGSCALARASRSARMNEMPSSTNETPEHDVGDDVIGGGLGIEETLDAVLDRHARRRR